MDLRRTNEDEKYVCSVTSLPVPTALPFCHPERSRISYFAALTSDHVCGFP
jgi:hypothetical protein